MLKLFFLLFVFGTITSFENNNFRSSTALIENYLEQINPLCVISSYYVLKISLLLLMIFLIFILGLSLSLYIEIENDEIYIDMINITLYVTLIFLSILIGFVLLYR